MKKVKGRHQDTYLTSWLKKQRHCVSQNEKQSEMDRLIVKWQATSCKKTRQAIWEQLLAENAGFFLNSLRYFAGRKDLQTHGLTAVDLQSWAISELSESLDKYKVGSTSKFGSYWIQRAIWAISAPRASNGKELSRARHYKYAEAKAKAIAEAKAQQTGYLDFIGALGQLLEDDKKARDLGLYTVPTDKRPAEFLRRWAPLSKAASIDQEIEGTDGLTIAQRLAVPAEEPKGPTASEIIEQLAQALPPEDAQVIRELAAGRAWADIGQQLGLTRAGAQFRFRSSILPKCKKIAQELAIDI